MRLIPLSEIDAMEDGEAIPSIAGRVKSVFDYKTGESEKGSWSFQDLLLSDGTTDVRIKATNLHNLDEIKGKSVVIESNKSEKHGLTGVKKIVEEYQGKTYHKVKLTGSCKIRENGEESDEIPMQNGIDEPSREAAETLKLHQGVKETRKHLMKSANLYNLCADCVDAVVKPNIEGMTADLFQAAIGTLYIEASRWGGIDKMLDKPMKSEKPDKPF